MQILVGIGTSRCLNILTLSSVLSGFNAVSDVFVLAISVPILMRLQTSLGRRLRLSGFHLSSSKPGWERSTFLTMML
jgi:hypothetical protein